MKKNNTLSGGILIITAAVMWGLDGVLFTPSYFSKFHFYDVKFIVFIAHAIPMFILSIFFFNKYKRLRTFERSDFLFFGLIGLFGGTLGTLSIVKALQLSEFSKFSIVILIQKTQPVFAILLAFIILKERPSKRFYFIAGICLTAVYLLTFEFKNPVLLPRNNLLASFYSLLAAFSFGSATVFGKKVVYRFSFLESTFFRFLFTTVITFLFILFSDSTEKSIAAYTGNRDLIFLSVFIAVFGLTAILIYYYGLKSVRASIATFCELAFPLTSVIIEAVILKRFLSPVQTAAAVILVSSLLYLNLGKIKIDVEEVDKI